MRKTHQVSSEESEPEQPESNVEAGAASADQPSSVGKNDIAWPAPVVSMYPLAAALSGLMVWAFGLDWVLVSLIPFVIFLSATTVIDPVVPFPCLDAYKKGMLLVTSFARNAFYRSRPVSHF